MSQTLTDPKPHTKNTRRAILLAGILGLIFMGSILFLLLAPKTSSGQLTAYLYHDGTLLETIDLSAVTESYTFTIETEDGHFNLVEVRPGAIGITDADCPDKLCVFTGFADSSLLPIVCLPHNLVIEVKNTASTPDAVTY